jgi:hypothetical protein
VIPLRHQAMTWRLIAGLLLACGLSIAVGANLARSQQQGVLPIDDTGGQAVIVVHSFTDGLAGVHVANADVRLSVGRDPSLSDEPVLVVEYPGPTSEPAGRDVQCAAENTNWTAGRALSFQIKPDHAVRLSVSFRDRNHVAYTAWTELTGGVWQRVRIPFDEIRPNPFFQPPDAKTGAPLDVSDVTFVAFAPQDRTSGRLAMSRLVVSK